MHALTNSLASPKSGLDAHTRPYRNTDERACASDGYIEPDLILKNPSEDLSPA